MCAPVSLPENCWNNHGWYDCTWSTDTPDHGLLSVSFLMNPELFPFVLHFLFFAFTNINDSQIGTSSFKSINIDGRNQSFSSLNMNFGWR